MKIKICRTCFSVNFYRPAKFNRYWLNVFSLRIGTHIHDLNIEQVSVALTLQACILHVLGTNLGQDTNCPRFHVFSSASVGKSRDVSKILLLALLSDEPQQKRRVLNNRWAASPPTWEKDVKSTRGRRYVWGSRVAKLLRCVVFNRESWQVSRRSLRLGSNSHFLSISNYLHGLMTDWHSWWRMGAASTFEVANMSIYIFWNIQAL
jgi:hypothetical protein